MSSEPNMSETSSPEPPNGPGARILFVAFSPTTSSQVSDPETDPRFPGMLATFDRAARLIAALHSRIQDLSDKPGPQPASKASIDAMPTIVVSERGKDCTVCLEEYEVGAEARVMPCKHSFHSLCIEKWLGINGSCPVCRFAMPVEEKSDDKDSEGGDRIEMGIRVDLLLVSGGGGGDHRMDTDLDPGR